MKYLKVKVQLCGKINSSWSKLKRNIYHVGLFYKMKNYINSLVVKIRLYFFESQFKNMGEGSGFGRKGGGDNCIINGKGGYQLAEEVGSVKVQRFLLILKLEQCYRLVME